MRKGDVAARLKRAMFPDDHLAAEAVGKDAPALLRLTGLETPSLARFLMIELQPSEIGPAHPFSGEKISPAPALYRARDFDRIHTPWAVFAGVWVS